MLFSRTSTYARLGTLMLTLWEKFLLKINLWSARKLDYLFDWDGEDFDWDATWEDDEC